MALATVLEALLLYFRPPDFLELFFFAGMKIPPVP
jgi:hypothetical protein